MKAQDVRLYGVKIEKQNLADRIKILILRSFFASTNRNNQWIMDELSSIAIVFIDVILADKVENIDSKYQISKEDLHPSALAKQARAKSILQAVEEL